MIGWPSMGVDWSASGSASSRWKWRARWRLRLRSAPLVVFPSACLRARYSWVAGSCWARVIAMMCSAWLSWRSPPRLSLCWVRFPDEHGTGAVPVCRAKLASERNRSWPAVWPIRIAAVSAPHPCSSSSLGRCATTSSISSLVQRVDLPVQPAQISDLVTGDPGPRACGQFPELPVDAIEPPRVVERLALERGLELGTQRDQMPAQPVDRASPLGDEIAAMIEQQADLHRLPVQVRDRELLDPVLDDGPGDRERVDLVGLARLALTLAGRAHPLRRDTHDPLAGRQQRLLQASGHVPTVLDRPHAIVIEASGPANRGQMPGIVSLDLTTAAHPAGSLVDRRQRVRSLVGVRSDHDHVDRPFVWLTPNEADLRRTTLTRGESHASIKSRRRSSDGGGRQDLCRSDQSGRHSRQESARRQPEGPTGRVGRHRPDDEALWQ